MNAAQNIEAKPDIFHPLSLPISVADKTIIAEAEEDSKMPKQTPNTAKLIAQAIMHSKGIDTSQEEKAEEKVQKEIEKEPKVVSVADTTASTISEVQKEINEKTEEIKKE